MAGLLLGLLPWSPASAQVALSEVLTDPAGSEAHDEFVELINLSDSAWVDLTGWRLGDGDELDQLVDGGDGLQLAPGQRAVVLDGSYAGASATYDTLRGQVFMLTIDDRAFGRSGWSNTAPEQVILCSSSGDTVEVFAYEPLAEPGRSWEKVDLRGGSGAGNWQLSRVTGGTPGRANSAAAGVLAEAVELEATPDPFDDRLTLRYRLPAAALLSIRIYDAEGCLVRSLLDGVESAPEGQVLWEGIDVAGAQVRPGLYVVHFEASGGGRIWRAVQVVARRP
ncbi:MAG: lamin tail domain-containing protein [Gemmatimonadota bacterium]